MPEAKFTPGLTVEAVFEHGTEIAEGIWSRCEEAVGRDSQGVICAVTDLMFLIDAYREALWVLLNDGSKRPPPLSPEERKKRADSRDRGELNDGSDG